MLVTVAIVVLTVACVALTVAVVGLLRSIADARLFIAGHRSGDTDAHMLLDAGLRLPPDLLAHLPTSDDIGVAAFVSDTCDICLRLAHDLVASPPPAPAALCVIDERSVHLDAATDGALPHVPVAAAKAAAEQLRIDRLPVVIVHQDGYIIASARAEAVSSGELDRLWKSALGDRPATDDHTASHEHEGVS